MKLEYIDIHSHLYFPDFDTDREKVIEDMAHKGIGTITIGTDRDSSKKAVDMAIQHEHLFACVGQHPGDVVAGSVFDEQIITLAKHPKVVAVGECGLDYFRLGNDSEIVKEIQKNIFKSHIELAREIKKPLMLHIRPSAKSYDAYGDALSILESAYDTYGDAIRGNAHFFAGDMDILKRFLAIGFTVSFTGVITFTHDYDEYIRYAPLDMIMSETDAPFVAPVPFRGSRNAPLYVPEVVTAIASIRGEDIEVVKNTLRNNAIRQFSLPV